MKLKTLIIANTLFASVLLIILALAGASPEGRESLLYNMGLYILLGAESLLFIWLIVNFKKRFQNKNTPPGRNNGH